MTPGGEGDEENPRGAPNTASLRLEEWEAPPRLSGADLPEPATPPSPERAAGAGGELPPPPSYPAPFPQLDSEPAAESDALVPGIPEDSAPRPAFGSSLVPLSEGEQGPVVAALSKQLDQIEQGSQDVFKEGPPPADPNDPSDPSDTNDTDDAVDTSEGDDLHAEVEAALHAAGIQAPPPIDTRAGVPPPPPDDDDELDKTKPDIPMPPLGRFAADSPTPKSPQRAGPHEAAESEVPPPPDIFSAVDDPEAGAIAPLQAEAGASRSARRER